MKRTTLLLLLSMFMIILYSQNENENSNPNKNANKLYFGIETGFRTFNSLSHEYAFIREEASYYYGYGNYYSKITWMSYAPFVSLKAEYRSLSDKFWVSAGVNYSSFHSLMGRSGNSQNQTDYFYIMLSQSQNESYYYRIKEIKETNHYIGVPIDIRYSPFLPRFFRLYFKLGFDFNLKVAAKQSVDFYQSEMNKHEDAILDLFDQPNSFYATSTLGVGIQLGKQNKPNFRIEADFPSLVLTPKAFGLMEHSFGGGARISFVLPLNIK